MYRHVYRGCSVNRTDRAVNFRFARHLFTIRRGAGHISEMPPTRLVKQLQ